MLEMLKNLWRDLHAMLGRIPFVAQLMLAIYWIWDKPLGPIRWLVWTIAWWCIDRYIWLWRKVTHDKYGGFVYWRGGVMVLVTVLTFTTILPITTTAGWIRLTYVDENVELLESDEIYPDQNIWSIRGREVENPEESLYYRVGPAWAHQAWSLIFMHRWFLPDDIASGVPTGITNCRVISYGIRIKYFMREWEWYPDALYVNCSPIREM